jgi:hypothetical protein
MRAGHAAAMARRRQGALSPLGPPFRPPLRPQQMGGMFPGDDGPLWQGQPQPIAETLRALSGVSAGNIASVSPQDPAEQTTPAPVVHPGTMGASGQSAPPRDEFAEAAAEAALNPDPAVERKIFEHGVKEDIEPPAAGQPVTLVNEKGEPVTFGEAALHGEGAVTARSTVRPKKAATRAKATIRKKKAAPRIGDKKQVIQYSNIIIVALQEALDYEPARQHNQLPPALYIDDAKYKDDIRELIGELRRLNDLLERNSIRAAKVPAIKVAKHLDKFLGTYGNTLAKDAAHLTAGVIAALLYQMGIGSRVVGHILGCLK